MRRAKILATGMYVPDDVVTNDLLAQVMDTSDEWITQRSGIKERRVIPDTYRMLTQLAAAPTRRRTCKPCTTPASRAESRPG